MIPYRPAARMAHAHAKERPAPKRQRVMPSAIELSQSPNRVGQRRAAEQADTPINPEDYVVRNGLLLVIYMTCID